MNIHCRDTNRSMKEPKGRHAPALWGIQLVFKKHSCQWRGCWALQSANYSECVMEVVGVVDIVVVETEAFVYDNLRSAR